MEPRVVLSLRNFKAHTAGITVLQYDDPRQSARALISSLSGSPCA